MAVEWPLTPDPQDLHDVDTLLPKLTPLTCLSYGLGIPDPGLSQLPGVSAQAILLRMTGGPRSHISLHPCRLTKQAARNFMVQANQQICRWSSSMHRSQVPIEMWYGQVEKNKPFLLTYTPWPDGETMTVLRVGNQRFWYHSIVTDGIQQPIRHQEVKCRRTEIEQ